MTTYTRSHLSDSTLLRTLSENLARERGCCAQVLADLGEVDARKLFVPGGYPSMFAYCVQELRFSRETAFKRIRAARVARRFPAIFGGIEAGRLNVSAVVALAAHLTQDNARELLEAASGRTTDELEALLAQRYPRPDFPERIVTLSASPPPAPGLGIDSQLSVRTVAPNLGSELVPIPQMDSQLSQGTVGDPVARRVPASIAPPQIPPVSGIDSRVSQGPMAPPPPRDRLTPLAPERFGLQLTLRKSTHDKLRRAQALLRHRVPRGELGEVLDHALDALIEKLEKGKFAATERPRRVCRHENSEADQSARHIPAAVRRAVRLRDGDRCTFVSTTGRRCESRESLEFDHVHPVARGGRSTPGNLRLLCRAHNQYEADLVFGAGFMHSRRAASRSASSERASAAVRE